MGKRFRKFVENGTGSRYVPLGTVCGLCGKRLGFFRTGFWSVNAHKLTDGAICAECAGAVEAITCAANEMAERDGRGRKSRFNTEKMTLAQAAQLIELKARAQADALSGYTGATALFRVKEAFQIAPGVLHVGVVRARRLKNKTAVLGFAESGDFGKGDAVTVDHGGEMRTTRVLEAYARENEFAELYDELSAHMGKQRVFEGRTGWLILESEAGLSDGDVILK